MKRVGAAAAEDERSALELLKYSSMRYIREKERNIDLERANECLCKDQEFAVQKESEKAREMDQFKKKCLEECLVLVNEKKKRIRELEEILETARKENDALTRKCVRKERRREGGGLRHRRRRRRLKKKKMMMKMKMKMMTRRTILPTKAARRRKKKKKKKRTRTTKIRIRKSASACGDPSMQTKTRTEGNRLQRQQRRKQQQPRARKNRSVPRLESTRSTLSCKPIWEKIPT